jgi:very-short-patch-repair endonuclease
VSPAEERATEGAAADMRAKIITLKRARTLRSTLTAPEAMLSVRLRRRAPHWPVFRRQHAIGSYILDFYCPQAKLAVEVDGAMHGEAGQAAHDERRDAWLRSQGIVVYRIPAFSVFADADRVADGIRRRAEELTVAGRPLRQSLFGD